MSKDSFQIYNIDALKYRYNGKEYVVQFSRDEDVFDNPRDWENNGTQMICFHPEYRIGDDHDYKNSEEFWNDIVHQFVPRDIISQELEAEKLDKIKLVRNPDRPEYYDVYESGFYPNENEWYPQYEAVAKPDLVSYIIGDISEMDCVRLSMPYIEVLPIWLYDHSGISISCGTRMGVYADPWDSSGIGYIYISREDAINNLNANEKNWREIAYEKLTHDVETYDTYLCGDIWRYDLYVLNDCGELEEDDCCGGFYGSDLFENGMVAYIVGLQEALENDQFEEGHLNTVYTGARYVFE